MFSTSFSSRFLILCSLLRIFPQTKKHLGLHESPHPLWGDQLTQVKREKEIKLDLPRRRPPKAVGNLWPLCQCCRVLPSQFIPVMPATWCNEATWTLGQAHPKYPSIHDQLSDQSPESNKHQKVENSSISFQLVCCVVFGCFQPTRGLTATRDPLTLCVPTWAPVEARMLDCWVVVQLALEMTHMQVLRLQLDF